MILWCVHVAHRGHRVGHKDGRPRKSRRTPAEKAQPMALHTCPTCGHDVFRVGRPVRIWQTLDIVVYEDGGFAVEDDELHDTLAEEPFEEAECAHCGTAMPLTTLFPNNQLSLQV
jgi:hypothetical protein